MMAEDAMAMAASSGEATESVDQHKSAQSELEQMVKGTNLGKEFEEVKFAYASMDYDSIVKAHKPSDDTELVDSEHGDDARIAQAVATVAATKALASSQPEEKPEKDPKFPNWGGVSWSPIFPTDRQLVSKVDQLWHENQKLRAKRSNDLPPSLAERRDAARAFQAATDGLRKQIAQKTVARRDASLLDISEAVPADQATVGTQPREARCSTLEPLPPDRNGSPPASSCYAAATSTCRKRRHDPAKIYNENGSFRLRGVKSTSDIARFTSGIEPHSRRNWEVRGAFKLMRAEQHSATVTKTWSALQSWCASERPFDQWYANAKKGVKYERPI
jgi:hypothetical protein